MDWQIELPQGCFYTDNRKALLDYEAFLFDKRFEPLNIDLIHFWRYRMAKAFTFPLNQP